MFSGGMDSTYLTLKKLQEGHEVVLYHVVLKNQLNRWNDELKACLLLVDQFKEDFPGRVHYVESTLDISSIKQSYDSEFYIPLGTSYANAYNIPEINIGFIEEDVLYMKPNYNSIVSELSGYNVILKLPLIRTSKKEVQSGIPKRYVTFSCRFPQEGKACGSCKTCRSIQGIQDL